jgi:hypothetical protein
VLEWFGSQIQNKHRQPLFKCHYIFSPWSFCTISVNVLDINSALFTVGKCRNCNGNWSTGTSHYPIIFLFATTNSSNCCGLWVLPEVLYGYQFCRCVLNLMVAGSLCPRSCSNSSSFGATSILPSTFSQTVSTLPLAADTMHLHTLQISLSASLVYTPYGVYEETGRSVNCRKFLRS